MAWWRREKSVAEWPPQSPPTGTPSSARVSAAVTWALSLPPSKVWKTQPYVRTVVDFRARNIAHLGLHTYRRRADNDRRRLKPTEHPIALLFSGTHKPNPWTTTYEMIKGLSADMDLYDRAYWATGTRPDGTPQIVRVPPSLVCEHVGSPLGEITAYRVQTAGRGQWVDVPANRMIYFAGFDPMDPLALPSSPLESLKNVIAEQAAAFEFRHETWENGAQVQGSITRPHDAPQWSPEARERFVADVRSKFGRDGTRRGGWMLLEDGMTAQTQQFNAREAEWIEAAKLSLALVASTYHVNPTMVGLMDNANYSNVREFRRMLYGDTLGPTLRQIEDRINGFLLPLLAPDDADDVYVEFNIAEKLTGNFEEQAAAFQTAVGAPWMTRAEARAKLNMPPQPGADELVVPLNVLVGGLASPSDTGQAPSPDTRPEAAAGLAAGLKARREIAPTATLKHAEVLRKFFHRQGDVVRSKLGAKADDGWWDQARWDRELGDDLYALAVSTSKTVAAATLDAVGISPDRYDVDRTLKFLRAVSARQASAINTVTKSKLDNALASDDPASGVLNVFEVAAGSRTDQIAMTAVTTASGFAATEAARQTAGTKATKTWVVTSTSPRPSHAAMDGETVGIDDPFSNGAPWPGSSGIADEDAGCTCDVEIGIEA